MKFYDFSANKHNNEQLNFNTLKNKVVLVVNTASKCGLTPQFETLEKMHQKYKSDGLVILGFPCSQFLNQEFDTGTQAADFCKQNYGVSFDIMQKIDVNGDSAHILFKYLKEQQSFKGFDILDTIGSKIHAILHKENSEYQKNNDIKWNFTKFLINKQGEVVERFEPIADFSKLEIAIKFYRWWSPPPIKKLNNLPIFQIGCSI